MVDEREQARFRIASFHRPQELRHLRITEAVPGGLAVEHQAAADGRHWRELADDEMIAGEIKAAVCQS